MAKVTIYTREYCSYCERAKSLLDSKGIKFEEIDVTSDEAKMQEMVERSGKTSVPEILINDKPIGGYSDLFALEESGELDKLLKED